MSARASRGLSLLELMIAMAVLSTGILGMVRVQGYASASDRQARARSMAAALAHDLVEHLERLPSIDPQGFNSPLLMDVNPANNAGFEFTFPLQSGDPATGVDSFAPAVEHNVDQMDTELSTGWPSGPYPGMSLASADPLGSNNFHRYWNVAVAPTSPSTKLIAAVVTYNDGTGSRKAVVLHTAIMDMAVMVPKI